MSTATANRACRGGKRLLVLVGVMTGTGLIASACGKDEIKAEHVPPVDAQQDTTAVDAPHDVAPSDLACPSGLPGAALVRIEAHGKVYCIDQREVSWGEYKAFIAAKAGDTSGQPAECAWNTSFEPEYYPVDSGAEVDPTYKCPMDTQPSSDEFPANCLDFCDALTYCSAAGKRLCGRIGGPDNPGRVDIDVYLDAGNFGPRWEALSALAKTDSVEFGYVCSQGGKTAYAYGTAYEAGRCIDATWVATKGKNSVAITDVSNRACNGTEAPFDQVYDLSGSVEEWENLCGYDGSSPTGTTCLTIGGSYESSDPTEQSCAGSVGFRTSKEKRPGVGFRCCADAVPVSSN